MKKKEKSAGEKKFSQKRAQKRTVPFLLFLDTASDQSRIVIFQGREIKAKKIWNEHRDLSETLLVEIDELLKKSKLKLTDLDQIAVNDGPGSYTGLRIGITVANFLAWSLNLPIVAASVSNGKLSTTRANKGKFIMPKYWRNTEITKQKS